MDTEILTLAVPRYQAEALRRIAAAAKSAGLTHADTPEGIVLLLIDHAEQGWRRPGAWERSWIGHAIPTDESWPSVYSAPAECYGLPEAPEPPEATEEDWRDVWDADRETAQPADVVAFLDQTGWTRPKNPGKTWSPWADDSTVCHNCGRSALAHLGNRCPEDE